MQYLLLLQARNIIAIVIGIYFIRQLSKSFLLIFLYLLIITVCEIAGYYLSFTTRGNVWLFNCFYLMPELILTGIAGMLLAKNRIIKKASPYLIAIGIVIWIINLYTNGLNILSNWTLLYIGIVLTIIYFDLLINSLFTRSLARQPNFWLSLSVIFYFCCTIPYFGMYNYLSVESPVLLKKLFYINKALTFIRSPFIAIAFYLYGRQQKTNRLAEIPAD